MSNKQYYNPDSFFGFMNLFKSTTVTGVHSNMTRPPFPPIAVDPTVNQVYNNLNLADLGAFTSLTLANLAFLGVRVLRYNRIDSSFHPAGIYKWRLFNFRINLVYITAMGLLASFGNSFFRLAGYTYNGNRWRNLKHENRGLSMVQDDGVIGMIKRAAS